MKHNIYIYLFLLLFQGSFSLNAQNNYDQIWHIQSGGSEGMFIKWGDNSQTITKKKTPYEVLSANSNISNQYGQLKYYSNGCAIMGANHKVLPHGDTLSPGEIFNDYCRFKGSYPSRNCVTILPMPSDTTRYFTFHVGMVKETPFDSTAYPGWNLYYSEINSTLNNGIGDVIKKNVLIVQDTFLGSGVKAVRHANGKDWWIIVHELFSPSFQTALLTSQGISYQGRRKYNGTALTNNTSKGLSNFSPNGKKYASGNPYDGIHIFDFDPCTGNFSNQRYINIGFNEYGCVGLEFSPNSRFLYATLGVELRQYDMDATDIVKSGIVIGTIDTTLAKPSSFYSMALAPNGKIYMAATHSNKTLNTIHQPNLLGKACDFRQQDFPLPTLVYVALPNIPKFRGNIVDEDCQTIATDDIENEDKQRVTLFPNPANDYLTIQVEQPSNSTFSLFDIQGKQVFSQSLQSEKTSLRLPAFLPQGIYFWRVMNGVSQLGKGKLVLVE